MVKAINLDENLESPGPHSQTATDADCGMWAASPDVVVGRASPRAAMTGGNPIEDGVCCRPPQQIEMLTRSLTRGDEAAFREFYDAYFDRLLRYLLVVTNGNEEASREALQLAMVRVVRHVKPFAAEDKFWSWLTVLARSALADERRKRRRYLAFLERFTRQQPPAPVAPDQGEADEHLHTLLAQKLTALPADERQLVEQKYLLRQSVRTLAEAQQTTEKAVESRLSRVRRKLKDAVLAELRKTENPEDEPSR